MLPQLLTLAADGATFSVADIAPVISSIGSVGFAVWFGVHVITKTIPDMNAAAKEERTAWAIERQKTEETNDRVIHELVMEMKEQRNQFGAWMAQLHGKA